ncbi:hypothetical protein, partial [Lactococcus garvieae]|uniref:hypothetical protein n=1 Tax=Lactococcus garvieae TaxID=1363 RepID=UPI00254CCABA
DIIEVFSKNLYKDVPKGDTYEGQKYEITDLENTYSKIKSNSLGISQLIVKNNNITNFDETFIKKQLIVLCYLMRWGTFSDNSEMWKDLYCIDSKILTENQVHTLNINLIDSFTNTPDYSLASRNVSDTFYKLYQNLGLNWTYKT